MKIIVFNKFVINGKAMAFNKKNLEELTKVALKNGASDIHIRELEKPCFRINGALTPIKTQDFAHEDLLSLCSILAAEDDQNRNLDDLTERDGSYEIPNLCRLRYNILKFNGKLAIVLRIISQDIPDIDKLKLPDCLKNIAVNPRGLILVTGATGSGKSSTLAAMMNHINHTKRVHIVTIEDPIEYLHPQMKARITQREIGTDTEGFTSAFRSALRQDPDVISIGEMRDADTASIALKAAETGHAILSTVHTTDAISTIGRLISMFPPEEQDNARKRLADNLYAIVSQRLLRTADGKGRCAALEIMINSPGVKECILGKEPLQTIYTYIEKGTDETGSRSFEQHIAQLLEEGTISEETAAQAASNSDLLKKMQFK